MNPFDVRRPLAQVHSVKEDRVLLDSRPTLELNNIPLSGTLEYSPGYDPVPQNLTLPPDYVHMSNMIQNVKFGATTIRRPVNGLALRPGKIGNVLVIIDLALTQKKEDFADWL